MRRLFAAASAISLALCLASACLWWRSSRWAFGMSDVAEWNSKGERLPIRWSTSSHDPLDWPTDHVEWKMAWLPGKITYRSLSVHVKPHTTLLLCSSNPEDGTGFTLSMSPLTASWQSQQLQEIANTEQEIREGGGWTRGGFGFTSHPFRDDSNSAGNVTQIERRAILPDWFLATMFALLPLVWGSRRLVLIRKRKAGCCLACGYDLRASKGRCPECGTPISPTE